MADLSVHHVLGMFTETHPIEILPGEIIFVRTLHIATDEGTVTTTLFSDSVDGLKITESADPGREANRARLMPAHMVPEVGRSRGVCCPERPHGVRRPEG